MFAKILQGARIPFVRAASSDLGVDDWKRGIAVDRELGRPKVIQQRGRPLNAAVGDFAHLRLERRKELACIISRGVVRSL